MRYFFLLFCAVLILYSCQNTSVDETQIKVNGLTSSVEIIRDQWGINHIYARNQNDLFFAQGYAAAKDRLFQFEIWRRQSLGTVSELLGPEELPRDVGTRLFKFRGDLTTEFNYYHPEGKAIIEAYVSGVNAYINEINLTPELTSSFQNVGHYSSTVDS